MNNEKNAFPPPSTLANLLGKNEIEPKVGDSGLIYQSFETVKDSYRNVFDEIRKIVDQGKRVTSKMREEKVVFNHFEWAGY